MGLKDLFAQNLLLRWLSGHGRSPDLAVSMAGVRLGERVVQFGLGDGRLLVALAAKVGYTGRACGVDDDPSAVARASRAAERAGVLVELEQGPAGRAALDAASFDLAVLLASGTSLAVTPQLLGDALRLLRPGGRCLVVMPGGAATEATPPLVDGLRQAGFKASRELARREGLSFLEATKAS